MEVYGLNETEVERRADFGRCPRTGKSSRGGGGGGGGCVVVLWVAANV